MPRLTYEEWNCLIAEKKIEDLSGELPEGFLMVGQKMRAKIRWEGVVYYASAWVDREEVRLSTVEKETAA